ncbi:MAG TPA: hypothetical protein VK445_07180, partial [Dissulfurispiraceae bacterium]|nr:hypothetical protein [Dissulfurispiraceae bacterium]
MNRREFLKFAGISTLFGLGGTAVAGAARRAVEYKADPKELIGKRWGIAIDMAKFKSDEDV